MYFSKPLYALFLCPRFTSHANSLRCNQNGIPTINVFCIDKISAVCAIFLGLPFALLLLHYFLLILTYFQASSDIYNRSYPFLYMGNTTNIMTNVNSFIGIFILRLREIRGIDEDENFHG